MGNPLFVSPALALSSSLSLLFPPSFSHSLFLVLSLSPSLPPCLPPSLSTSPPLHLSLSLFLFLFLFLLLVLFLLLPLALSRSLPLSLHLLLPRCLCLSVCPSVLFDAPKGPCKFGKCNGDVLIRDLEVLSMTLSYTCRPQECRPY